MIALSVFILCYLFFILAPRYKAVTGLIGALVLILLREVTWRTALWEFVNWNVVGLFFGTLVLAELFLLSRVPAVLSEWLVDRSKNVQTALMSIYVLASIISMFVENVAVVLLVGPVAMSLCKKLNIPPFKPMVLLAMFSNLQGTATLIGDPPSMLMGGYLKMNFNDFFIYQGRLSVFFIVQIGAIFALAYAWFLMRGEQKKIKLIPVEKIRSWVPSFLLVLLIFLLAAGSFVDPEVSWLAGTAAMVLAFIGCVWQFISAKWISTQSLLRSMDWKTTFFFISLFILVGSLQQAGWMDAAASGLSSFFGNNLLILFIAIIGLSILVSAFVDNVPFLLAAIPIVADIARLNHTPIPLLMFALLIGTCLGGNITPIGASANIVAVSLLEKENDFVTYKRYLPIGLAFTACAVIPASLALWMIWN
ncbi:MAG: arsenic transporter [Parachlamydia sp.]|nr:MAG: arsenic transporter [Parachlamydia sp.]